jgi:hypothetical protein
MSVAQIQEMWQKLNANERLVSYGAIIVLVAWLVGLIGGGGFGWPLPVPTLVLLITGISAVLVVLTVLPVLGLGLFFYGGIWVLAFIADVVGVIVMAYGAWREYQSVPKTPTAPPPPPPPAA